MHGLETLGQKIGGKGRVGMGGGGAEERKEKIAGLKEFRVY